MSSLSPRGLVCLKNLRGEPLDVIIIRRWMCLIAQARDVQAVDIIVHGEFSTSALDACAAAWEAGLEPCLHLTDPVDFPSKLHWEDFSPSCVTLALTNPDLKVVIPWVEA